ncbi:hypothetical protein [Streptomyces sp. NPDC059991]|uniref:hypothetical protein n=1 Tax=unclassified Streptomyces TaxID=2593676 RepID=UPI0036B7F7B5
MGEESSFRTGGASHPAAGTLRPLRDPAAPELDENDESAANRRGVVRGCLA